MSERQDGKTPGRARYSSLRTALASVVGGTFFGGLAYGASSLLTSRETAERIAIGVGGGFVVAGAGAVLSSHSLERAEDYCGQGRATRARLEVVRAGLEAAAGFGGAGAIAGFESGSAVNTTIGAGVGVVLGAAGSLLQYRERTRKFPELVVSPGNSMKRDTSFIDREDGRKLPPVYRASSLRDLKEFRQINKETIVNWVGGMLPETSNNPLSLLAKQLVTAVVIIPNLRHFPVRDPQEKTLDMTLVDVDGKENIVVHPHTHAFMHWPYQTRFEKKFGDSTYFEEAEWKAWREDSWENEVVLMVQYQSSAGLSIPTPDKVSDNYWLLDIRGEEDDHRRRVSKEAPQGGKVLTSQTYRI